MKVLHQYYIMRHHLQLLHQSLLELNINFFLFPFDIIYIRPSSNTIVVDVAENFPVFSCWIVIWLLVLTLVLLMLSPFLACMPALMEHHIQLHQSLLELQINFFLFQFDIIDIRPSSNTLIVDVAATFPVFSCWIATWLLALTLVLSMLSLFLAYMPALSHKLQCICTIYHIQCLWNNRKCSTGLSRESWSIWTKI